MRILLLSILLVLGGCGTDEKNRDRPGPKGAPGEQGEKGEAGEGCTVERTDTAAVISCPDGTSATIHDGNDGADGKDFTPVNSNLEYVDNVCNNIDVFKSPSGVTFVVYSSKLIVLVKNKWKTIWINGAMTEYCKVKLHHKRLEVDYVD